MPPDQGSRAWRFHADKQGKWEGHPWGQQSQGARQGPRHDISVEGPFKSQVVLRGRSRQSLQCRCRAEGVEKPPAPLLYPLGLSRFKLTCEESLPAVDPANDHTIDNIRAADGPRIQDLGLDPGCQ